MYRTKSKIIVIMCVALFIMVIGYGAFSTMITITGTANIASEWKVVFTKIEQVSKTSGVSIKSTPVASGTTATFNVGLTSPGDKIVYKITLANQGTIDAVIKNIEAQNPLHLYYFSLTFNSQFSILNSQLSTLYSCPDSIRFIILSIVASSSCDPNSDFRLAPNILANIW